MSGKAFNTILFVVIKKHKSLFSRVRVESFTKKFVTPYDDWGNMWLSKRENGRDKCDYTVGDRFIKTEDKIINWQYKVDRISLNEEEKTSAGTPCKSFNRKDIFTFAPKDNGILCLRLKLEGVVLEGSLR